MRPLYPAAPLAEHPPLRPEREAMEDIRNARRQEALDFLVGDVNALKAATAARGYRKIDVWYIIENKPGESPLLRVAVEGDSSVFYRGGDIYQQAVAWIEALPGIPRSEDYAADFTGPPVLLAGAGA